MPHGARLKPYSADFGGPRGGSKSRGCPGDPLTLQVWKPRPQPRLWFRVTAGDRALVSLVCPWFPHPFWRSLSLPRERRVSRISAAADLSSEPSRGGGGLLSAPRRARPPPGGAPRRSAGRAAPEPGGHVRARGEPVPGRSAGGVRLRPAEAAQGVRRRGGRRRAERALDG